MKLQQWQFNALFVLAILGAVAMLFADKIGITVRPEVVGVFGLVMAFVLQQKDAAKKGIDKKDDPPPATPSQPVSQPVAPQQYNLTPEMRAALQALADKPQGVAPPEHPTVDTPMYRPPAEEK